MSRRLERQCLALQYPRLIGRAAYTQRVRTLASGFLRVGPSLFATRRSLMRRAAPIVAASVLMLACTSSDHAGPRTPSTEDELYTVFLLDVLERSLAFMGPSSSPSNYCVAITTGSEAAWTAGARAPSSDLLDRLSRSRGEFAYHSIMDCALGTYGGLSPSGEFAGLLWVAPWDANEPDQMVGGWIGRHDETGWRCALRQSAGRTMVDGCELWLVS